MSGSVEIQSDFFKHERNSSFQECFLCGSRDYSSKILEENREKWTQHFCQLYGIEIAVTSEEFMEIQSLIQNGFYCINCLTELESISQFYKTIEDINSQLRVIQLQCELKLKSCVESLEKEHENMKEISNLEEHKEDDGYFLSQVCKQKQQLLKCMTACCRPDSAAVAASVSKNIHNSNSRNTTDSSSSFLPSPKDDGAEADQDFDDIYFEDTNDNGNEPLDPSNCVQTCQNRHDNNYEDIKTKFNLKNVSLKVDRIQIKPNLVFNNRKIQASRSRTRVSSLKRKKPSRIYVLESTSESESIEEIKEELIDKYIDFDGDDSKSSASSVEEISSKKIRRPKIAKMLKPNKNPPRRFQCEFCGKPYRCIKSFKNHVSRHAEGNDGETPAKKPPAFKCETCGKTYTDKGAYKCHLLTHDESQRENLGCKHCHKILSSKHQLKLHEQRVHTGNFGFKCDQCNFGAVDNGCLQHHLSTVHSDARPFECDICQHTFKTRSYLNRHKKLIHPISKDFVCSSCGKCFSNKRYLQEHEETHKEVKSFLCPECGKYFTQKTSLKKHMGKVHGTGSL